MLYSPSILIVYVGSPQYCVDEVIAGNYISSVLLPMAYFYIAGGAPTIESAVVLHLLYILISSPILLSLITTPFLAKVAITNI